ncbi:hypothetical protein [Allopusillimonas ginsengisoli]|uniref:hypothetical protein n=1 Tax=Allopusillimonas ginsengisoli TaxID=453575 RepID=UPI00101EA5AB|nr:hypothetical protein [Allopusillimonas ginsengisoli]TEA78634.1 hypothetical protein ERE07_09565 [Allopusillimonas ginsengisoli]
MPAPNSITDLDPIAANNTPQGGDLVGGGLDDILRGHASIIRKQFSIAESVPSSSSLPIPDEGSYLRVTKAENDILTFTDTFDGRLIHLSFEAGITLKHSESLVLPGAKDIVTELDDAFAFVNTETGVWQCLARIPTADTVPFTATDLLDAQTVQEALELLGTAATLTATTSDHDSTEGRALRVGDFGLGGFMVSKDLASADPFGLYYDASAVSGGTFILNMPYQQNQGGFRLSNYPYQDRFYLQSSNNVSGSLKSAVEIYHTGNFNPASKANVSHTHTSGQITNFVSAATAALVNIEAGLVGSTCLLRSAVAVNPNSLVSGANLRFASADSITTSYSLSGTWRCMGYTSSTGSGSTAITVFIRIS